MSESSPIKVFSLLLFLFVIAGVTSCSDDSEDPEQFNRQKFLEFAADEKIIPAYENLARQLDILKNRSEAFLQDANAVTLEDLRNQWKATYKAWLKASIYNFGPAGAEGLDRSLLEEISTFPVDVNGIESKIANAETGTNDFERDTRGLLAIEYLIFDFQKNDQVIEQFQDSIRQNYLTSIIGHSKSLVQQILEEWKNAYRDEFIANDGTDAGSSTSLLFNEFIKSYEVFKNFKLGIPLGLRAGQSQVEPEMVEALYSGGGVELLHTNFESFVDFWYGNEQNPEVSFGFKYYLQYVEGGASLISATEGQIDQVRDQFSTQDVSTPLSDQISSGNENLINLHTEIQRLTRFFKSDLSSLIGIAITYDSGDGD